MGMCRLARRVSQITCVLLPLGVDKETTSNGVKGKICAVQRRLIRRIRND